jgi:peroxiredoxin Q/BCP
MGTGFGTDPVPLESDARARAVAAGARAPTFSLPDADMEYFDLAHEIGRHVVVLYFFPRDGTPTAIQQAIDFSDHDGDFADAGAIVVGVSPDDVLTHASFRDEHGLSIRLLSDPDIEVCRLYGVLQPREREGVPVIRRASFVIGLDGIVRHALHETRLRGHAAEVLDLVRKL